MMQSFSLFSFIFLLFSPLFLIAAPITGHSEPKISINNRILARVNGKPLTTYDLVKKMDLAFYKQYPQYASSNMARFQFYQQGWSYVLDDLITEELILADAKESHIEVSAGDVRQEMEEQFGPNVISSLDKAGMSLEEAYKALEAELILQRTIGARVNTKALRQVTPLKVRQAYEEYLKDPNNRSLTKWTYRVITIKDRDRLKSEALAKVVHGLLLEGILPENLAKTLADRKLLSKNSKVTLSKPISSDEKELSSQYKDALDHLEIHMYSQPFPFKSRALKTTVYRIIILDEKMPGGFATFKEVESKIKQFLLAKAADKETEVYIKKLREHYHVRDIDLKAMIPKNYEPFTLSET